MLDRLQTINQRPAPFSVDTAEAPWIEPHTGIGMLEHHLDDELTVAVKRREGVAEAT